MRVEPGLSVATASVARIRTGGDGIVGTGFLIGDAHVMTCAHVVDDALGRNRGTETVPECEVRLDLPFLDRRGLTARVVAWRPMRALDGLEDDPVSDIAVLELREPVAGGLDPRAASIVEPPLGTGFQTFGFPASMDNGTEAGGELRMIDAGGWRQLRDTQGHGHFVAPGFSGAPILAWEPDRQGRARLLGMVVAADADAGRRLAFAIPTATLAQAWPLLARPYKGLESFQFEDASLFFGREEKIDELVGKVAKFGFVTLLGPSGSGKSSVVRAGLVPRLSAQGGWAALITRPGDNPLYELARTLTRDGPGIAGYGLDRRAHELAGELESDPRRLLDLAPTLLEGIPGASRLLLVIDQFEELFTLGDLNGNAGEDAPRSSDRQRAYIAVLEQLGRLTHDAPLRAVATLRADFTGRALEHAELERLMSQADVKLGPLSPDDLARAIELPARRFGVEFEPGLVPRIVGTMSHAKGGLPLMQFALDKLWQRQRDRILTHGDYDAIGGVEGALADHAEAFYAAQPADTQESIRRVLTRLVRLAAPGEQAEDTRAVIARREIGEDDWRTVLDLARARLVTTDRDPDRDTETAELVHEALISFTRSKSDGDAAETTSTLRSWNRLKSWLDEDREFGLWRQRLRGYVENFHEKGSLLPEDLVAEAQTWRSTHGGKLNETEKDLIGASLEAQERKRLRREKDEQERVRLLEERNVALADTARRQKKWFGRLAAVVGLLLLAISATGYFWWRNTLALDRAELAETRAVSAAREAKGRQLAAEARILLTDVDGTAAAETAAALAIEGLRRLPTPQAYQVAVASLWELPMNVIDVDSRSESRAIGPGLRSIAVHPDGSRVAVGDFRGRVHLVDPLRGDKREILTHSASVEAVAYSADGRLFATGSDDRSSIIIYTENGEELGTATQGGEIRSIAFAPDGDHLMTNSGDGATIYDLVNAAVGAHLDLGESVYAVAYRQNGKEVALGGVDGLVRVLEIGSGAEVMRLQHEDIVSDLEFSPDGRWLASSSEDDTAILTDVESGSTLAVFPHEADVNSVAFDTSGRLLATGSGHYGPGGDSARIFLVADGADIVEVARIKHDAPVRSVAFSQDGSFLVTASDDGKARIVATEAALVRIDAAGFVDSMEFSPDGRNLVALIREVEAKRIVLRVSNSRTGAEAFRKTYVGSRMFFDLSPDGRLIAVASDDGNLRVLRADDGTEIFRSSREDGQSFGDVAFSPDGRRIAAVGVGGFAAMFAVDTGQLETRLEHDPEAGIEHVAFDASGTRIATAETTLRDGAVSVFDVASGRRVARVAFDLPLHSMALDPAGKRIAVGLGNAAGAGDGVALIYDIDAGTEISRVPHVEPVDVVLFSPDGSRLATASEDGTAQSVDPATGEIVGEADYSRSARTIAFSPDGSRLASSGGPRGSVRILEPGTGVEIGGFDHFMWVSILEYSPDGKFLAMVDGTGAIMLFEADAEALSDRLCKTRAGRNLSREEWRQYMGEGIEQEPTCSEWRDE